MKFLLVVENKMSLENFKDLPEQKQMSILLTLITQNSCGGIPCFDCPFHDNNTWNGCTNVCNNKKILCSKIFSDLFGSDKLFEELL